VPAHFKRRMPFEAHFPQGDSGNATSSDPKAKTKTGAAKLPKERTPPLVMLGLVPGICRVVDCAPCLQILGTQGRG